MDETSKQRYSLNEALEFLVSDAVLNVNSERLNRGVFLIGRRHRDLVEMAFRNRCLFLRTIFPGEDISEAYSVDLEKYFACYGIA